MSALQQYLNATGRMVPTLAQASLHHAPARPAGALDRLATTVRLARGEAICHEGDDSEACYQVVSGCLRLSKLLPDGRRHVLAFAFPGDFIGSIEQAEHDATAEALAPTTLARFPRRQLAAVAERDLAACNLLRRLAVAHLAAAQARGMVLARLSAAERVASFLLELAGRGSSGDVVAVPMTRTDIGDYLGLTIETVSRTFTQFKARGFIAAVGAGHVRLVNARGLAALAEGGSALAA